MDTTRCACTEAPNVYSDFFFLGPHGLPGPHGVAARFFGAHGLDGPHGLVLRCFFGAHGLAALPSWAMAAGDTTPAEIASAIAATLFETRFIMRPFAEMMGLPEFES